MNRFCYFSGTSAEAQALIHSIPAVLAGIVPDYYGIANRVKLRAAVALLGCIQEDFVTKARGGTGRDGIQWEPLKPETVARRKASAKDKRAAKKVKGTKVQKLGYRPHEILRDTGELLRSFSPGVEYTPSGADGQILELDRPGSFTVGTNKKPWHHEGGEHLPSRPFWPLDGSLPDEWMEAVRDAVQTGIEEAIASILSGVSS